MICTSLILGLHLASYHAQHHDYQNNVNPGAYVECDGWTAGAYRNTLSRTSAYAGYTLRSGPFALSLGAISGYQKRIEAVPCQRGRRTGCTREYGFSDSAFTPMVAPSVTLGPARLWYIPSIGVSSSVLHLSLQKEFK
jgi:hypothetical protein